MSLLWLLVNLLHPGSKKSINFFKKKKNLKVLFRLKEGLALSKKKKKNTKKKQNMTDHNT